MTGVEALKRALSSDSATQAIERDLEEAYEAEKSFQEMAEIALETATNIAIASLAEQQQEGED